MFLAQEVSAEREPVLVAASALHTAERVPWFRNWRLAWLPVGALAAGITVAYVMNARHEEPAKQMAEIARQASPVGITPASDLQVEPAKGKAAARRQAPATKLAQAPPPLPVANGPTAAREKALAETLGVTSELKAPAPEVPMVQKQGEPAEAAGEMQAVRAKKAESDSAEYATQKQVQVSAAAAPMLQAEAAAAPRAARASGLAHGTTTSMAVYMSKQTILPGGLAAVSIAAAQHNMLAIDKAGSLFLSTDGGAHWEGIERQWSGLAVAVRSRGESKGAADALSSGMATAGGGSRQNGFELVNDQGQVWVSSDGRSWKAQ